MMARNYSREELRLHIAEHMAMMRARRAERRRAKSGPTAPTLAEVRAAERRDCPHWAECFDRAAYRNEPAVNCLTCGGAPC